MVPSAAAITGVPSAAIMSIASCRRPWARAWSKVSASCPGFTPGTGIASPVGPTSTACAIATGGACGGVTRPPLPGRLDQRLARSARNEIVEPDPEGADQHRGDDGAEQSGGCVLSHTDATLAND